MRGITVIERASVPSDLVDLARRAGLAALEAEGQEGFASVVLVDDEEIAAWNEKWLKRQGPTDVIAFAAREGETLVDVGEGGGEGGGELGDVLVSAERARAQAVEYGCTEEEELARLVIHGILHLLGWDDSSEGARLAMEKRTESILTQVLGAET